MATRREIRKGQLGGIAAPSFAFGPKQFDGGYVGSRCLQSRFESSGVCDIKSVCSSIARRCTVLSVEERSVSGERMTAKVGRPILSCKVLW